MEKKNYDENMLKMTSEYREDNSSDSHSQEEKAKNDTESNWETLENRAWEKSKEGKGLTETSEPLSIRETLLPHSSTISTWLEEYRLRSLFTKKKVVRVLTSAYASRGPL